MRVLFRIIAALLSAYAIVFFGAIFWRSGGLWIIVLSCWLISWAVLALITKENSPSRLLTHFRYAPVELHAYRGWCGNGYIASIYALYGDVAAEGFESSDPAVRAHSLRASIEVYDSWNGADYGPFPRLIERAFYNDPDPLVRKIAAEFHVGTVSIPKAPNDE